MSSLAFHFAYSVVGSPGVYDPLLSTLLPVHAEVVNHPSNVYPVLVGTYFTSPGFHCAFNVTVAPLSAVKFVTLC